jgi:hypothetical protein
MLLQEKHAVHPVSLVTVGEFFLEPCKTAFELFQQQVGYIEFLQGLMILKESGASSKQKLQKLVRSRKYRPLAKNNFKKNIKL